MTDLEKARLMINDVDRNMAALFEKRMDAVRLIAQYKKEHGVPVEDPEREEHLIQKNTALIENEEYRSLYVRFLRSTMGVSKDMQRRLLDGMRVACGRVEGGYDIWFERGLLGRAGEFLHLKRKVLIVTDGGVPAVYAQTVAAQCADPVVCTIPQGEQSKQIHTYTMLLETLVENRFTRTDCVVAVGGGVVGDLAGFAAATYMRGIDFYNIPTTVLSQVDSSIGGKTAIDFMGLKNLVGAFYPPKAVLIDPDTLSTLSARQVSNGLAEAVKMALTSDSELFTLFETADLSTPSVLDEIIRRALLVKKQVVEEDEREAGVRKILNFGHTLAHAIESVYGMDTYYHGECVALGMVPMCAPAVRERLLPVLRRLDLPTEIAGDAETVLDACRHDKKMAGDTITVVYVPQIGSYELKSISFTEYEKMIREVLGA